MRLVATFCAHADWTTWEIHPAGEELVVLLSGCVDMLIDRGGTIETVRLDAPGRYAIIPRDSWHTANVHEPTRMLFIPPGAGTRHADRARES